MMTEPLISYCSEFISVLDLGMQTAIEIAGSG